MNNSRKMCKKTPSPWIIARKRLTNKEKKLIEIIQNSYKKKYGMKVNLSTKEIKDWGEFLIRHRIYWDIIVSSSKNWPDWECYCDDFGKLRMRPKNIENHTQILYYYIPNDLILKMIISGVLPQVDLIDV